jgi:hypothetical protein
MYKSITQPTALVHTYLGGPALDRWLSQYRCDKSGHPIAERSSTHPNWIRGDCPLMDGRSGADHHLNLERRHAGQMESDPCCRPVQLVQPPDLRQPEIPALTYYLTSNIQASGQRNPGSSEPLEQRGDHRVPPFFWLDSRPSRPYRLVSHHPVSVGLGSIGRFNRQSGYPDSLQTRRHTRTHDG